MPAEDFRRLAPHLKSVALGTKQILHKRGEPIHQVYFPNGGVCSITTVLSTGTMVEAAMVGDEGMVGIEAFLSADAVAPGEAFMHVPDTNAEMLSVESGLGPGKGLGQFGESSYMAMDARGDIYVSHTSLGRVQKLIKKK